jgi:hypothetical protein
VGRSLPQHFTGSRAIWTRSEIQKGFVASARVWEADAEELWLKVSPGADFKKRRVWCHIIYGRRAVPSGSNRRGGVSA